MPRVNPDVEAFAKIKVIGVGGSGGNALKRMIDSGIQGVDFVAVNTDAQDLHNSQAEQKVHLGKNLTRGLGAGGDPEIGKKAAEESKEEVYQAVNGSHMVFITCGLGGGTGSGAGPIVAEAARETGALTVGVVTKPFTFEGMQRKKVADKAFEQLKKNVDTIITIPNDKILNIIERNTPVTEAFSIIDDVLRQGVQGISDLITTPGLINVDFADVSSIMKNAGSALMGIGSGEGEERGVTAAKTAVNSPLLDVSIEGARGVLFNITGRDDLSMTEINDVAQVITESIDPEAHVIFGTVVDESLPEDTLKVTVIATGFDTEEPEARRVKAFREEELSSEPEPAPQPSPQTQSQYTQYKQSSSRSSQQSQSQPEPEEPAEESGSQKDSEAEQKRKAEEKARKFVEEVEDEDDFEVPAFIRNKMK